MARGPYLAAYRPSFLNIVPKARQHDRCERYIGTEQRFQQAHLDTAGVRAKHVRAAQMPALPVENHQALLEQYRLIHRSLAEAKEPVTSVNNHATDAAFQLAVSTGKPIRGTNNANGRYAVQVGGLMGESVISDMVRSALAQRVEAQDGVVDSKDATRNSADEPETPREGSLGEARDKDTKRSGTSADEAEQFHLDSRAAPDGALQVDVRTPTGRMRGYIPRDGTALRNYHPNTGERTSTGPFLISHAADCFQVAGKLTSQELQAALKPSSDTTEPDKNDFKSYGPGRLVGITKEFQ